MRFALPNGLSIPSQSHIRKSLIPHIANAFLLTSIICLVLATDMIMMRIFPIFRPSFHAVQTSQNIPKEIIIKDVHIDLPVIPARYANGTFETTTKGVSFLTSTHIPGTIGNSVMYAHNWWNLFGSLVYVTPGEEITVVFQDKSRQTFLVKQTKTVPATQVSILDNSPDRRLTLFTCTNFLDADRFVVIAIAEK